MFHSSSRKMCTICFFPYSRFLSTSSFLHDGVYLIVSTSTTLSSLSPLLPSPRPSPSLLLLFFLPS